MLRRQWPLIVLLALLTAYLAAAIAVAVSASDERAYGSGPKLHAPSSTEERAAAGAAVAHLHTAHHRGGSLKAIDASVHGETAGVAVSEPGCVNFVSLRRSGATWRVVEHHIGGYL